METEGSEAEQVLRERRQRIQTQVQASSSKGFRSLVGLRRLLLSPTPR